MKNQTKLKTFLIETIGLIAGCLITSIGINMFLKPFTIAPGGLSGLSLVINKLTGLSVSLIMLVLGIPLIIFSIKILGKKDALKTLIGMLILSFCLEITSPLSNFNATSDVLLSAISGALLFGVGLGIIFSIDASTGGTDLIALMLHKIMPNVPLTKFMLMLDGMVVISAGIANKNLETALYSGGALFIISKVVDGIISGFDYSKSFIIISDKPVELKNEIMEELHRGATFLCGKGGYTEKQKDILLIVIPKKQEVHLKKVIKAVDPNAFIIISEAYEVLGEGFKAS
ncbi:MAG: YitT family protein [Clostridium sp.]